MRLRTTRGRAALTATAVGLATLGAAATALPASATTATTVLRGDVLPGLDRLTSLGATAPDRVLEVGVTLSRPNPAGEAALEKALYTPGSPSYHQFLTPAEFDATYGVPAATTTAVRNWATRDGLTVASAPGSGDYLLLSGTAAQVQRTFSVHLADFRDSTGTFYANTNAPTVPAGLRVVGVIGLNSKLRSHTFHTKPPASAPHGTTPAQDTCTAGTCIGLTTPQDLWSIYDQPSTNMGEGMKMAIFGEGQTTPVINNLRTFESLHKLRRVPITVVHADGPKADYSDNSGEVEWDLDTQSSTGMAPNVYGEKLYFGKDLSDASVLNVFNTWADDAHGPAQASASYGECEENPVGDAGSTAYGFSAGAMYTLASEAALRKAVFEGRTLFSSTGDTGSSCPIVPVNVNGVANEAFPVVNYPASSPHAVAVGGTVLYGTDASGGGSPTRSLEYSWTFTGGGTSVTFAKPDYQNRIQQITGICVSGPGGNMANAGMPCRGVPDVAAQSGDVASNGYGIVAQGETNYPGGGTSLSSPLMLGMWTRIQAAAPYVIKNGTKRYPGLGFANPVFYRDYASNAATDFFDVGGTNGKTAPTSNGYYTSTPGWDYTSGLGVPDVTQLMTHVTGRTTPVLPILPKQPPVTGTGGVNPCAPVLFTDPAGDDAYIGDPNGGGSNPQLDLLSGNLSLTGGNTLVATLTLNDLSKQPASAGGAANDYYLLWNYQNTQYFATAEVDTTTGAVTYGDGTVSGNQFTTNHTDTGTFNAGKNGTITVNVPLANVGNPPVGATLTAPGAQTRVLLGTTTTGGFIEQADAANPRYDYQIGATCTQ